MNNMSDKFKFELTNTTATNWQLVNVKILITKMINAPCTGLFFESND